ncbi:MAG: VWA domain-containing protein [Proteobacteria bacterium]|nr:VWA domain-containing protein [Pseudomonadota bacterium]
MQRWQLTLGLAGLALTAAVVAPTLRGALSPTPAVTPSTGVKPVEPPAIVAPPIAEAGHLIVDAGLDRSAVLTGDVTERFLTVHVTAPNDLGTQYRRPVDLGVVVDRSCSMSARGKIDYAKAAAKQLLTQMEPDDVYSLVVFSDDAVSVIDATHVDNIAGLQRRIDGVHETGDTNIVAGLDLGAKEIRKPIGESAVGRIVLLSDGRPTAGVVDPDAIVRRVAELTASGISVSSIGLGLDYNEDLLARIADVGGGSYDFVDNPRELTSVFEDELERSAAVVARGTKLTLNLGEGIELLDVIGWEGQREAEGTSFYLGDVTAGQTVKLTARVRVTSPDAPAALSVATATAEYYDLVDEKQASSTDTAEATITRDRSAVASSLDKNRAVDATRAWGNAYLDRSTRAYASGDRALAQELAAESAKVLREAGEEMQAPQLLRDADNSVQQQEIYDDYSPSSAEGRRSIKAGKEYFRAAAK